MKWLLLLLPYSILCQTITLTPIGNQDVSGIPVTVEHQITTGNGITSVRIFRTHYGNGNTSQYAQYPMSRSEMDKLFNASYAATTLWWSGNINATSSLNFYNYTTLTSAGASVPSNGDYYTTEVTFTMVPLETGTYSFGLASDDGSDLWINTTSVIEYYGGKGVGPYRYGTYYMVAGQQYNVIARMQEYGGGDGLVLVWKRPSQSSWSLQTNEIGISSTNWVSQGIKTTNSNGQAIWTNSFNRPYRVTIDITQKNHTLTETDITYLLEKKTFLLNLSSWDFYTCDLDNSGTFNFFDMISGYNYWLNNQVLSKYVFTNQQKLDIEGNPSTNYKTTYPLTQNLTTQGTSQFYIIGLGKHKSSTTFSRIQ